MNLSLAHKNSKSRYVHSAHSARDPCLFFLGSMILVRVSELIGFSQVAWWVHEWQFLEIPTLPDTPNHDRNARKSKLIPYRARQTYPSVFGYVTRVTKSQRQRFTNLPFTRNQIESMANATRTRVRCHLSALADVKSMTWRAPSI